MHMRSALWVALSNPDEWWGFHLDSYTKPPEHYYTCKDRRVLFQAQAIRDKAALAKDLDMEFVLDDPRWPQFQEDTGALGRYGPMVHELWDRGLSQVDVRGGRGDLRRHGGSDGPVLHLRRVRRRSAGAAPRDRRRRARRHRGTVSTDVRPPWQMSATPATRLSAPRRDQHGTEIRAEIVDRAGA